MAELSIAPSEPPWLLPPAASPLPAPPPPPGLRHGRRRGEHLDQTRQGDDLAFVQKNVEEDAQLGLKPGDVFEIKLGKKQIRLVPAGDTDEEE